MIVCPNPGRITPSARPTNISTMEVRIMVDMITGESITRGSTGHLHTACTFNRNRRLVKFEGAVGRTLGSSQRFIRCPWIGGEIVSGENGIRRGVAGRRRGISFTPSFVVHATAAIYRHEIPTISCSIKREQGSSDLCSGSEAKRSLFLPSSNSAREERSLLDSGRSCSKPSAAWKFISVAAAGLLSLTLCTSAVAASGGELSQTLSAQPVMSSDLEMHVETQLRRELRGQMVASEDDVGGTPSAWAFDARVKTPREAPSRKDTDESGKAVSTFGMRNSEAVAVVVPPKTKKVGSTGPAARDDFLREGAVPRSGSGHAVAQRPLPAQPLLDQAPELRAVAAVPLGPMVSAATRTVGSAKSVAVIQASAGASAPGGSLLARIMMHLGGGGVAGAMGATLVYPLDTIKTRMQAQSKEEGEEEVYKDEWDCFGKMLATEGPGSLYSGLLPQLVGIAPEKAMKLTVNDVLMDMLEGEMPGVGAWALELIAGGGGGFSQVVFTNPMEIVKVRLQTQAKGVQQKNSWDVIRELGLQGLYDGSTVTMARDIPSSAIFFAIYTFIRQRYPDQSFMAGFVAAIPATVLVTPMDVIKTRVQMEKKSAGQEQYKNGYACFTQILREEGIGVLFTGSLARVLKTSPQFGVTLMLYNIFCGDI